MIRKKSGNRELARARLSLASRLLGGAVRATLPVSSPQEPWRDKKSKGKKGGKRQN
jgi:hypothetical protein